MTKHWHAVSAILNFMLLVTTREPHSLKYQLLSILHHPSLHSSHSMASLSNDIHAKREEGGLSTKRGMGTEKPHLELDMQSVRTVGPK